MPAHASIGVYDDFTPGQTGIALRAADNKTSGWIHQQTRVPGNKLFWKGLQDYFFLDRLFQLPRGDIRAVLRGNHHGVDGDRAAVFVND